MRLSLLQLRLYKPVITVKDPWGLYMYHGLSLFFHGGEALWISFSGVSPLWFGVEVCSGARWHWLHQETGILKTKKPWMGATNIPICEAWCWYIYLHDWVMNSWANVGIHIPAPWFADGIGHLIWDLRWFFSSFSWSCSIWCLEVVRSYYWYPLSLLAIPSTPWFDQEKVGLGQHKWYITHLWILTTQSEILPWKSWNWGI